MIGVYSATLNEDEIDDESDESEDQRSRKGTFLKSMEEKITLENPEQKERYLQVKNQILEKVKANKISRSRSWSSSSISSQSTKRNLSDDLEPVKPPSVRIKTGLPVKST